MAFLIVDGRALRALGIVLAASGPPLVLFLLGCSPAEFYVSDSLAVRLHVHADEVRETRHFTLFARSEKEEIRLSLGLHTVVTVCRPTDAGSGQTLGRVRIVADAPSSALVDAAFGSEPCMDVRLDQRDDPTFDMGSAERGVTIEIEREAGAAGVALDVQVALDGWVRGDGAYSPPKSFESGIREDD